MSFFYEYTPGYETLTRRPIENLSGAFLSINAILFLESAKNHRFFWHSSSENLSPPRLNFHLCQIFAKTILKKIETFQERFS
jgi:hypothetical protein